MSTQHYKAIVVTGVVMDPPEPDEVLCLAHRQALALFEDGLVSAMTSSGHNFIASFAVFPTGSSQGREAAQQHSTAITAFLAVLARTGLDYVAVEWGDHVDAKILEASRT